MAVKDPYRIYAERRGEIDLAKTMLDHGVPKEKPSVLMPETHPVAPPVQQPETLPESSPDLAELARLQRVEKYQRRRHLQSRNEFRRVQIATAKANRLAISARHVRRILAECIRAEDKQSFANLYNAFHDACSEQTCSSASDDALDDQPLQDIEVKSHNFMDVLSPESRDTLLHFLSQLRFDASFVAERLASLGQRDLSSLLPDYASSRSSESVLGGSQRTTSRSVRPMGFAVDRLLDDLAVASFRSPLEALAFWDGPGTEQGQPAVPLDLWATVCAKLICDQKHGSERLIPALFDIASFHSSWPGKTRLEMWLVGTLRDGQFLLDQPSRQSFKVRMQGQADVSGEERARADAFYGRAMDSLLDLLGDASGPSVVPPAARQLTEAIYVKLADTPAHQEGLPKFLVTRWLFSTLMTEVLLLPESHALLQRHYISDLGRQRILKELAVRSQRTVFDVIYSWYLSKPRNVMYRADRSFRKHGNVMPVDTVSRVAKILDRFDFTHSALPEATSTHSASQHKFFTMSATNALTLLKAVHPSCRATSLSSDNATIRSGLQSSASSVSGFSLFRTAENSPTPWTHTAAHIFGLQPPGEMCVVSDAHDPLANSDVANSQAIADLRTELEEWLAGHRLEEDANWVLLAADGHHCQVFIPDGLSHHDKGAHVIDSADTNELCRQAIDSLFQHPETANHLGARSLTPIRPDGSDIIGIIDKLFSDQVTRYEASSDYVGAHTALSHAEAFDVYAASAGHQAVGLLVSGTIDAAIGAIQSCRSMAEELEERFVSARPQLASALQTTFAALESFSALRDKMWYTADVRTSSAYDNVRAISSALRIMGKPKRSSQAKQAPPLRHWSTSRISSQSAHLKSEAQILDLMASTPERGGPNKLSGEQATTIMTWMKRVEIQMICNGEERLHKLCMEVRKCVDVLIASPPSESPLLFANVLYDRSRTEQDQPSTTHSSLSSFKPAVHQPNPLALHTSVTPSNDSVSVASHTLSNASSRDYFDMRSPTLTTRSSASFWSPAMTEIQSPSSVTSVGSYAVREPPRSPRKPTRPSETSRRDKNYRLRANLTSLLLSDISANLFADGCETDRAYWSGLGGELVEQHLQSQKTLSARSGNPHDDNSNALRQPFRRQRPFNFESAFGKIFRMFSNSHDPFAKLKHLNDVQTLLPPYAAQRGLSGDKQPHSAHGSLNTVSSKLVTPGSDISVQGFYALFCDPEIRPPALLRDLQYIAALVPASILESSPQGKAFWNAAIAASQLKSEARKVLVETADSIIAYHTNNRGHGRSASIAQQQRDSATFATPSRTPSAESIAKYSMADAAELLQITARDGDPAAQRELATLYLTHPELMDLIIAPFARPKDVFRDEMEGKWRRDRDDEKCDPRTMCVAIHWMVRAAEGGDALASEFLRQREEMENLP